MNLSMQTQENTLRIRPFTELKISKVWNYVDKHVGRFACARCGRSYARKNTLQRHEQWECGKEPQFKCPFCPQRCKRKTHWQRHIRRAKENRSLSDLIEKEEESMNLSMQTQENTLRIRPFTELKISKVWNYVDKHVGCFACSRCGRSYKWKTSLQRHERLECGKEPQFKCPFCPQRCKRKEHWQHHIRKWHTDKVDIEEYLHSNMPKLEFD
ncbi:longitudinals lacking protein, isoforms N/O/W/X/Y-like [Temnothorax longispinosus]|uniref:longitudinals lacking protein, isoforms N/O/W/X/Y-like n=1 Tax=Temnothorax longispinosus TaxID=300112 RepID=UPI003A98FB5C